MTSNQEAAKGLGASQEIVTRMQRLESVVRLTAGAGHEFNNLIQTIMGALQLVPKLIAAGRFAEIDRLIERAIRAARTASELNQHLVRLAQPHDLNPRPLAMNELIASAAGLLSCSLPRSFALGTELAPDLWATHCDHHRAEIALLNLVFATVDAMSGHGTITLSTRNRHIDRDQIPSIDLVPGSYVVVGAMGEAHEGANRTDALAVDARGRRDNRISLDVVRRFADDNRGGATFDFHDGRAVSAVLFLPRFVGADS